MTPKNDDNIRLMKSGLVTVKKIEAYKEQWRRTYHVNGYKHGKDKIIEIEEEDNHFAYHLLNENRDWIIKCLCNNTNKYDYNRMYGGYSKGCYEIIIQATKW